MTCSVRVTDAEKTMAMKYADFHGISISQAFRDALMERIEDELDAKTGDEASAKDLNKDGCLTCK